MRCVSVSNLLLALLATVAPLVAEGQRSSSRRAAIDVPECPRDALTSFSGAVVQYIRGSGRLKIAVEGSLDAGMEFDVSEAEDRMTLRGEKPSEPIWSSLFDAHGLLSPDTSVIVWVCEDEDRVVGVDWYPFGTLRSD